MKFFRLVRYDFGRNLWGKPMKWVAVSVVCSFLFFTFIFDAVHSFWSDTTLAENIKQLDQVGLSFGDGMIYLTGGMLPVSIASVTDNIQFPVRWLFVHILVLYITLEYARNDLTQGGVQVLIRTRNRQLWWFSKCVWNVVTVFSCFAVGVGVWYLLSLVTGRVMDFSLNATFFSCITTGVLPIQERENVGYILSLCVMPAMICAVLSLWQMTLTLYIRPVFAYMVICVYYIVGVYYTSPVFLSNYAMSVRSATVGLYNFRTQTGFFLSLLFGIGAVVTGSIRMRKMDVINRV